MPVNFTDMYDAYTARSISRGGGAPLGVILSEIQYIQTAIDTAAPTGALSVTIANATVMTNSEAYFNAWQYALQYTDDTSVLDRSRMDAVIRYFVTLGYRVVRQRIGTTNYMQWIISW